ncbi:hypothetical protein ANANG_G00275450 [Anguilla anguilla]|uniref:Uncharacterized protein n=1 Tax=Anguilla anguilla TaxID=7936 RepID=A0A9D3LVF2_ANGAN|nr:hypothetical protein ANANG_G00275450 [Anguilla anguilla]
MATWTRFLQFSVICTVLLTSADKRVFRSQLEANTVLQRPRRSNTFLLEEILQGNLERECYEESCTFEEAREYFEDIPKTEAFWAVYRDGDQCNPNPCLNGANCTDKIGGYRCECKEFYDGVNCERDVSQCHSEGPWSCDHFCRPTFNSYHCTCAGGYKLHSDRRTCLPEAQNPCGRAPVPELREPKWTDLRSSPASQLCPHGRCPWQVSLLDAAGRREICSGVVLGQRSILTAAVCASMSDRILVALGEQPAGQQELAWPDEQPRPPGARGRCPRCPRSSFTSGTGRASRGRPGLPACAPAHQAGRGSLPGLRPGEGLQRERADGVGPGRLGGRQGGGGRRGSPNHLSYLPLEDCRTSLNLSFPLTNKMFCMAGWGGGGCGLLPGTPVVSVRKNTVFLTD